MRVKYGCHLDGGSRRLKREEGPARYDAYTANFCFVDSPLDSTTRCSM